MFFLEKKTVLFFSSVLKNVYVEGMFGCGGYLHDEVIGNGADASGPLQEIVDPCLPFAVIGI